MDHSHHHSHHEHQHAVTAAAHAPHKETDNHAGHDKHAGHHTDDFLKRFWICVILTVPVLALSHMIQQWFGFDLKFNGDNYLFLCLLLLFLMTRLHLPHLQLL